MEDPNEINNEKIELPIDAQIEGFLFWKAESVTYKEIGSALGVSADDIKKGVFDLKEKLLGRGISLIETEDRVELRTSPALSSVIEKLTKEELDKDLGKAGLETLSIVLYEGPIARRDIDHIRGVNSQFIVRALLARGLIERNTEGKGFVYKPTTELLAHLGVSSQKDLPEYASFREEIQKLHEAIPS